MTYILESKNEIQRLEVQNAMSLYDVEVELANFHLKANQSVLDVGCGTGALLRHLAKKDLNLKLHGIDLSRDRLNHCEQLMRASLSRNQCELIQGDLVTHDWGQQQFDLIVSRFVLHHLADLRPFLEKVFQLLKPIGEVVLIDSDGILFNMSCDNRWLMDVLNELKDRLDIDLFAARKMKSTLCTLGFHNVSSEIQTMHFTGEGLKFEAEQYEQRFQAMMPKLENLLGICRAKKFANEYCEELKKGDCELFYNKFICYGKKGK